MGQRKPQFSVGGVVQTMPCVVDEEAVLCGIRCFVDCAKHDRQAIGPGELILSDDEAIFFRQPPNLGI